MNDIRTPSFVIISTLFCLSFLGFFVGGGVFVANVEIPKSIDMVGGLCFFFWWLPSLIGFLMRNAICRLEFTSFGSIAVVIGCIFILLGSALFFAAASLLASGPIDPQAQKFGDYILGVWWIPGLIGVVIGVLSVIYGIDDA